MEHTRFPGFVNGLPGIPATRFTSLPPAPVGSIWSSDSLAKSPNAAFAAAAIPPSPVSKKQCSRTSMNETKIQSLLSGPQTLTSSLEKYSDFVNGLITQDTSNL